MGVCVCVCVHLRVHSLKLIPLLEKNMTQKTGIWLTTIEICTYIPQVINVLQNGALNSQSSNTKVRHSLVSKTSTHVNE